MNTYHYLAKYKQNPTINNQQLTNEIKPIPIEANKHRELRTLLISKNEPVNYIQPQKDNELSCVKNQDINIEPITFPPCQPNFNLIENVNFTKPQEYMVNKSYRKLYHFNNNSPNKNEILNKATNEPSFKQELSKMYLSQIEINRQNKLHSKLQEKELERIRLNKVREKEQIIEQQNKLIKEKKLKFFLSDLSQIVNKENNKNSPVHENFKSINYSPNINENENSDKKFEKDYKQKLYRNLLDNQIKEKNEWANHFINNYGNLSKSQSISSPNKFQSDDLSSNLNKNSKWEKMFVNENLNIKPCKILLKTIRMNTLNILDLSYQNYLETRS